MIQYKGEVSVFEYKILDRTHILDEFKIYTSYFLRYITMLTPNLDYPKRAKIAMNYKKEWYHFIVKIYNIYYNTNISLEDITEYTSYEELVNLLQINTCSFAKTEYAPYIWGRRTWPFLHLASILSSNTNELIEIFSCLMLNFNIVIICGICAGNFKKKNPFENLLLKIKYSKDPITVLYDFHNTVNIALGKKQYTITEFTNYYRLNREYIRKVTYVEELNI